MSRSVTIHKTTIQNKTIRKEPVEKIFKTNLQKNNNNVPTESSILSETVILKSDTDENINIEKNDHKKILNSNNRKIPTIYHSSKEFLKDLAKGAIYLNSQPYTKITTTAAEVNLNTITQYTSPVVFKKINTTSPITNITKDTSTSPIQIIQYNQNFEPVSVNLENTHNYKNETNYEKSAPRQSINYDRETIPTSTDEIPKTTNIKIIQKNGSEYTSDDISYNNNNNSDSSFFPDSEYSPNIKTKINKKVPKPLQKKARNKKYTTTVNDYINHQLHLRLQKIPKHRNKNITTITKIVEQKGTPQLNKKLNNGISQIQRIEKISKIKYRNIVTHDIDQQYQNYTSEDTSSKLEEDNKKPYNNIIQASEEMFLQNDKISIQHPK